jgi:hypothetical protein
MKTWMQRLFCERCGKETFHRGTQVGLWEVYMCKICHARRMYKVG